MRTPFPVFLVGAGHAHPTTEVSSEQLEASIPGLSPGWSKRFLGMDSRRLLGPHESAVGLAIDALHSALDDEGWDGSDLDLIVSGSSFPDNVNPASAAFLAQSTNPAAVAFDVGAVCATALFGIATTLGQMAINDAYRRVAVCVADHPSAWADYSDRQSSVFWGDAGAALLLDREPGSRGAFELLGVNLVCDSEFPDRVHTPSAATFRSDAKYSFSQVVRLSTEATRPLLSEHGVKAATLRALVVHQSNVPLIEATAKAIGVEKDRLWTNVAWAGNQASAGVLTAFSAGMRANRDALVDGDLVVLASVGGGYTGGAALLRWTA